MFVFTISMFLGFFGFFLSIAEPELAFRLSKKKYVKIRIKLETNMDNWFCVEN